MKTIMMSGLAALVCSPGAVAADVGSAGTVAIHGDLDLALGKTTSRSPGGSERSITAFQLGVTASYFVADRLSLGARLTIVRTSYDDERQAGAGAVVLVGTMISAGERLYVWPQVGIGYARTSIELGSNEAGTSKAAVELHAPLYYAPAEHLLVGVGPYLSADVHSRLRSEAGSSEGSKLTSVALLGSVVGWF